MGRQRKYFTKEEKRIAKNKTRMKYYWKNYEIERKKSLERYYNKKYEQ